MALDPVLWDVLDKGNAQPTLVDIGASGGCPEPWRLLAPRSTYVAFDPDRREFGEGTGDGFKRSFVIPYAVVGAEGRDRVTLNLTHNPFCSSTLEPDMAVLSDYSFWPFFRVERTVECSAITLDAVWAKYGLDAMDWLKVDSQGTDLAILQGLGTRIDDVIACELEPGFLPFYKGESVFRDIDAFMAEQGFWLAHLDIQTAVRFRPETQKRVFGDSHCLNDPVFGSSPVAPEALYFRPLRYFRERGDKTRRYVKAWSFAVVRGKLGFAMDLARDFFDAGDDRELARYMMDICKTIVVQKKAAAT